MEGLKIALERGESMLRDGAAAVHVAARVVASLEDHPAFDAGLGAVLNRERHVELDAGIMCGNTLRFGAVAGVKTIRNPVNAALRLLEREDGQVRFLVAAGAEQYARNAGMEMVENASFVTAREVGRYVSLLDESRYHTSTSFLPPDEVSPGDTVGCVVRDHDGNLAAATSTGGTPFTIAGRVGDSPLPGAGFYANEHAAVSATGWGEAIAASACAVRVCDLVEAGLDVEQAVIAVLERMHREVTNPRGDGATGGLIAIDRQGRAAWTFNTPRMARAGWKEGSAAWTAL